MAALLAVLVPGACGKAPPHAGDRGAATATTPKPSPGAEWKHIEFAILEDYDKGEDLRDVERDFQLFRELGIHTWRGSFAWDDYEPARGRFDFEWLHRFCDLAERDGITLRPYIGYTPEWAAAGRKADGSVWNDPPAHLEDWAQFIDTLATAFRRHKNIASYEIYNEENTSQWWDGSREEYEKILEAAANAIHRESPGTQVALGGLVWPDPDWIQSACAADPRAFDIVPFHAYPETWTPDSIRLENDLGQTYRDFLEEVRECGDKPVWINETGFATVSGKSELAQARWWARAIATFAAAPRVSEIGVCEIKDLRAGRPAIGGPPNYHLGLTTADRRKKLAFQTVAFLAGFFRDSVLVDDAACDVTVRKFGDESGGGAGEARGMPPWAGVHHHFFRRASGEQLLVLWSRGDPAEVDLTFPVHGSRITSFGVDGRPRAFHILDGRSIRGLELEPEDVQMIHVDP